MAIRDEFIEKMTAMGGSDLHLPSANPPMVRIHGELEIMPDEPPLSPTQVRTMTMEILEKRDQEILFEHTDVDFVYEPKEEHATLSRFRANVFFQKNGLNIVLRGIPRQIPTLSSLDLPRSMETFTHHHHGLVLVTGPAGCGKTATLAALIDIINEQKSLHIITVEDPIEYVHQNKRALIIQRQVGLHVDSFQTALRAALREDPDVIMVGEMRDLETMQLAITASETGHLVFGTLHTNGSIQTIDRIIDIFPPEQQMQIRTMVAESLRGIVSQQLIPKKDGSGRVVAYELLQLSPSVANQIREGKNFQIISAMQMGKNRGMQLMDTSILDLAQRGTISRAHAIERAIDPRTMEENLDAIGVQ
ncbi:MAG: PilT/PilU family type 4a pilus ATPase [bacterium]